MLIFGECVSWNVFQVGSDFMNGEVYFGQFVGGGSVFLFIYGDFFFVVVVVFNEFDGLYEYIFGVISRVIDDFFVGFNQFGDQINNVFGCIEFFFFFFLARVNLFRKYL